MSPPTLPLFLTPCLPSSFPDPALHSPPSSHSPPSPGHRAPTEPYSPPPHLPRSRPSPPSRLHRTSFPNRPGPGPLPRAGQAVPADPIWPGPAPTLCISAIGARQRHRDLGTSTEPRSPCIILPNPATPFVSVRSRPQIKTPLYPRLLKIHERPPAAVTSPLHARLPAFIMVFTPGCQRFVRAEPAPDPPTPARPAAALISTTHARAPSVILIAWQAVHTNAARTAQRDALPRLRPRLQPLPAWNHRATRPSL
ncbi:hypothetical protein HETIRDRAFT_165672 [Heterobasidion irregulare TC 32-1]|uniref:Uncharacterized protein n=1 Tax=Heterobasidion irregulare (strain TC 32-1) TaxID=747525 RepID=W4KBZ7_HETIT|nr:uncharacterized protein HETIRDRAFT_165672 [Heterobasidion irregulare TC 32-1]ETW83392.1 hypothetical protein HETIRDRAFT_165672 [Heterobasidion irregulare TC 32-1]